MKKIHTPDGKAVTDTWDLAAWFFIESKRLGDEAINQQDAGNRPAAQELMRQHDGLRLAYQGLRAAAEGGY